ncbi:MAG: hypothetical protein NTV51_32640, partial [Verrucomicrobia bacterium]|nr:hypothetical protein [Verrucomicrobiota bacterium]
MNPLPRRAEPLALALFGLAAVILAFRFWTSFCFFPFTEWNDVRLAPTFMLWHGVNPYPALASGPITTWTYGPVGLLLNLPAVLGRDLTSALFIAGVLNLLLAIVPAVIAVFATPTRTPGPSLVDRGWALLLCLAVWPTDSLHYTQSDNAAIAFGLLSCVLLLHARTGPAKLRLGAALCAALALWSKQTVVGLIAGQVLWLGLTGGLRAAVR